MRPIPHDFRMKDGSFTNICPYYNGHQERDSKGQVRQDKLG